MEGNDAILLAPRYRFCRSCREDVWGSSCGCAGAENYSDSEWQQSSILPYIENQKYTFGSKYTSREDQGEFIFVQTTKNPGNLAEITCSGGNYWITPAGKHIVLVNDNRLEKNCRTRLNHGDKIALLGKVRPRRTRRGLDPTIKHESLNGFFLFEDGIRAIERQKYGEDSSMPDNENNVDYNMPRLNHLVLSHIFSYLPINTLKKTRLVCSQWDAEAARILVKKSTVVLNLRGRHNGPIESARVLRYVKEMENLQPTSLNLALPSFTPGNYPDLRNEQLLAKLGDDLNWFLQMDRCYHITRLNLGGRIFSVADYKTHIGILAKLQATLCDLELSLFLALNNESSDNYAFPTDLQFKKLAAFTFSISTSRADSIANQAILSSWAGTVQHVKTIQLGCNDREGREFVKCLLQYEKPFPNLEAFSVTTWTREIVLDLLLKLTNPLKKLKLKFLRCLERRENFSRFENLIRKHADTLEGLQFIYDQEEEDARIFHLPILPRLKMLSVGWTETSYPQIGFPSGQDNNDVLNYERHLPRLEALSLSLFQVSVSVTNTNSWEDEEDILDIFFPTRGRNGEPIETRCVTLRELDARIYVPFTGSFLSKVELPPDLPLTDMFPNVWNDWMTRRREEEAFASSGEESLSATDDDMDGNTESEEQG